MAGDGLVLPAFLTISEVLKDNDNVKVVVAKDWRQAVPPRKVVLRCYSRTVLQNNEAFREGLERKLEKYHGLFHKHVLTFSEVRVTRNHLVIFFDYIGGGTLEDELQKLNGQGFTEDKSRFYFQQFILILHYMMEKEACSEELSSRDLKLGNFLLSPKLDDVTQGDDKFAILYDFGISTNFGLAGARNSSQEEAVTRNLYNCGSCLYRMLTGEIWNMPMPPQQNADFNPLIACQWLSAECKEFVRRMLHHNCDERLSMDQIWRHPWFNTEIVHFMSSRENAPDLRAYNHHVASEPVRQAVSMRDQTLASVLQRVEWAADPNYNQEFV